MTYDNENAEDVNPLLDFGQEFNNEEPKMWFKVLESNMLTRGMEAVLVSNSPILANQGPKGVQSTYLQGKSG